MTTTATSVDLVKNLYAAFGRGDIPTILASLTADCQWISSGEGIPNSGHYVGPAGAAEFFQKLAASEDVTRFEPREYFTSGDDVIAHGFEECRIKSNGRMVSTTWMMLFRIRQGKVAYFETVYDTAAYAAAHKG